MNKKEEALESVTHRAQLDKNARHHLVTSNSDYLPPHHTLSVDLPCSLYTQLATYATETGEHPNDQITRGLELYFNEIEHPTSPQGAPRTRTPSPDSPDQTRHFSDDVPVVQLNTRVALPYQRFIKRESQRSGQTVRSIIEGALAEKYGVPDPDDE